MFSFDRVRVENVGITVMEEQYRQKVKGGFLG